MLLPEEYDGHPDAHHPELYYQFHFPPSFSAGLFITEPPPSDGGGRGGEAGYRFYQE